MPVQDPQQMPGVMVVLFIFLMSGGLWWYSLPDDSRREYLVYTRAVDGIEAPVPLALRGDQRWATMGKEAMWLIEHRARRLEGMMLFFLQVFVAVLVEGMVRRRRVPMSGFGLGMFTAGRIIGVCWVFLVAFYMVTPYPVPLFATVAVLGGLLGLAGYVLSRGMPRIH